VQEMTRFLELLVNSLNVDENYNDPTVSRIGMLTYSYAATVHFWLNTNRKRTEILQAINVHYRGGTTNTSDAIRYNLHFEEEMTVANVSLKYTVHNILEMSNGENEMLLCDFY